MTDGDGDGKISFEEFMGWWTEGRRARPRSSYKV